MGRYVLALLLLFFAYVVFTAYGTPAASNTPQQATRTATSAYRAIPAQVPDYRAIARQDARDAGIDADLFVRQINEESGFNPSVISRAGAIGIAQFMPATARGLGINPYEPLQSLKAAALLMSGYVRLYHDYAMALAAYNAGPGTLASAFKRCSSLWRQCLPAETRAYIHIIMME